MVGPASPYSFGSLGDVRRAGKVLRRAQIPQGQRPTEAEVRQAREVVEAYRSAHAAPLNAAYMGLRSSITTEGLDPDVTRRLKRLPTIEDKLRRLPTIDLSTMQDIGGCRAVLDTQEQVQRVADRFRRNSHRRNQQRDKTKDYVDSPRETGYRAIHIYTRYHGRRIEVQLRTPGQDLWATFVEALTQTSGTDFKNGKGPDEAHDRLRKMAAIISMGESGQRPTEVVVEEVSTLAVDVVQMSVSLVLARIQEEA